MIGVLFTMEALPPDADIWLVGGSYTLVFEVFFVQVVQTLLVGGSYLLVFPVQVVQGLVDLVRDGFDVHVLLPWVLGEEAGVPVGVNGVFVHIFGVEIGG